VVLAASTHEGEDAEVIAAFALAREKVPDLHLVIAPRHPRRRDRIEAALGAAGLSYSTRSRGRAPDGAMDAYLADTLGEMGNWYAAAAMTFVGGSLVDRGGHTPFEPAAHGSAIVSGLHVGNFRDTYAALAAAGACRMVGSGADLAEAFGMLRDPAFAPGLARRAAAALADRRQGGLDVILRAVEGFAGLDRAVRGRGSSGEGIAGKRAQDVIR
jgi:3-deoxy-D-manno-octulosonic-acid transferase